MQFTKKLREPIRRGDITSTIRIWKSARVKVGNTYPLEGGAVRIESIQEMELRDVSDKMARESGFAGLADWLKIAKHGKGMRVFFIRFKYLSKISA